VEAKLSKSELKVPEEFQSQLSQKKKSEDFASEELKSNTEEDEME